MKALIFGANGQDGFYLAESCRKRGFSVIGVSRSGPWVNADVASEATVSELVRMHQPQLIFHLAASSTTSHHALYENHATIGTGTINILEAVKNFSRHSKVFITGSGLQFVNNGLPISENDSFDHTSAYVTARNYSVSLARYFRQQHGVKAYVGYLFHHESPLRSKMHISQKIVQAVRKIVAGQSETIELGDVSVQKEWTFAGDVAEGIMTLIAQDKVFEATIGSGKSHSIADWLEECFKKYNMNWREHVRICKNFNPEYKILLSDPSTINALGWSPVTSFGELNTLMLRE